MRSRGTIDAIDSIAQIVIQHFWEDEPTSKPLTTLLVLASLDDTVNIDIDSVSARADSLAFYLAYFNNILRSWCLWEEECRVSESKGECRRDFGVGGAAFHYSSSLKELLLKVVEDHGLEWLVPYWLRWYVIRTKSTRMLLKLSELPIGEQLLRLIDYPVMATSLEALTATYLDHYSRSVKSDMKNFAYSVVAYVYWDIVKPFIEVLWQRMSLVKPLYIDLLEKLSNKIANATRSFIEGSQRLQIRSYIHDAMRTMSVRLAYLITELKTLTAYDNELREKLRLKLMSGV